MVETNRPVHSPLGASQMHIWSECPKSVQESENAPDNSSEYAARGTFAHEVAAEVLKTGKWPDSAFELDQDEIDSIELYAETINWERESLTETDQVFIEHGFDLNEIYEGCYGTADCVVYDSVKKKLSVFDYKHGAGVPVDVENNPQLLYYGLGALLSLNLPCSTVELVIVQPRCYHPDGAVRRWVFQAIEILDFAADLKKFAARTKDPNAPYVSGDHCRWCKGAGTCPKLHENAVTTAKSEFQLAATSDGTKLSYDPKKLAETLKMLPQIDAWMKAVKAFAYNEASLGRVPEGFKLVAKRATRHWRDEGNVATEIRKATRLREDFCYERKLKSPAQMEKMLKEQRFTKEVIADLIVSESSGTTLVPETDTRLALKLDAKSEFDAIEIDGKTLN